MATWMPGMTFTQSFKAKPATLKKTMTFQGLNHVGRTSWMKATTKPVASKKVETGVVAKPLVYVVQEGDSLWRIAQRAGVKVDEIKKLNGLKSDALKKGTVLKLPSRSEKVINKPLGSSKVS